MTYFSLSWVATGGMVHVDKHTADSNDIYFVKLSTKYEVKINKLWDPDRLFFDGLTTVTGLILVFC